MVCQKTNLKFCRQSKKRRKRKRKKDRMSKKLSRKKNQVKSGISLLLLQLWKKLMKLSSLCNLMMKRLLDECKLLSKGQLLKKKKKRSKRSGMSVEGDKNEGKDGQAKILTTALVR